MRQGDSLTSLISAGPPCQADRRKLFIPKLKWDIASYHSYSIQKLIIYGACGKKLDNETGLPAASMASSTQKAHLRALQRSVFCLYSEYCGFHSSGISIDHEELLLWCLGAVNWHKIPRLWQKSDGSWGVKQSFNLTNRLNQYSWLCHEAVHFQVLWMSCKPS